MSSTITVSRRVGAFRSSTATLYALFETTYESNVFPKTPRESCVAFGTYASVCLWIMAAMRSACEGMLRRPGGMFTPVGYWSSWAKAFKEPGIMCDQTITIQAGDGWRATVPRNTRDGSESGLFDMAMKALKDHGYESQAVALDAGDPVEFRLHADGDVLAAIYGNVGGERIAPWRVLHWGPSTRTDPGLAPVVPVVKHPAALPDVFSAGVEPRSGEPVFVALLPDGRSLYGDHMDVLGDFLGGVAYEAEINEPGAGIEAARLLSRTLQGSCESLPARARVLIDIESRLKHGQAYRDMIQTVADAVSPSDLVRAGVVHTTWRQITAAGIDLMAHPFRDNSQFSLPSGGAVLSSEGTVSKAA